METIVHKSNSRGYADHGWLKSYHSFSFANYYNPEKINFGALRVLNDDYVQQGMGFGKHPHRDMEIISIPLEGDLEHQDSMGTKAVIRKGEVQVMSAGTGIMHSEYNKNPNIPVKFLQIWVIPKVMGVEPRYDQISIEEDEKLNNFQQILSPNKEDAGVWIHQDAWFNIAKFEKGNVKSYKMHKEGQGVYAFVLSGEAVIAGEKVESRDAVGVTLTGSFEIEALSDVEILLMEVPMNF